MPAVDTEQQQKNVPPPIRLGLGLVNFGVERARNVNVLGLATLPLRGLTAVRHPRRTAEWAFGEATELIDRFRGKTGGSGSNGSKTEEALPSQEEVAQMVEQVTDPFGLPEEVAEQVQEATPGATLTHDQLPLEDYDHLTLGSLRARLPRLDAVALVQLRDYERAHANRLPVLTMLENRIAKIGNQP